MHAKRLRPTSAILLVALVGLFLLTGGIESWTLHGTADLVHTFMYVGQVVAGIAMLLSTFFIAEVVVRDRESQLDRDRIHAGVPGGEHHHA